MAKMTTFFWRDIPSHVIYKAGRKKYKKQLDPKFAIAIDRAAMRAGKGSSEAYMQEWRRETQRLDGGDPEELIEILVNQLEDEFPDDILEKTIKSSGIKPK
jgi:hypothetical protein|tara:strand:- start:132 stop:434 length:303 start_codon:yes stop_codon:yes gene_type:complete